MTTMRISRTVSSTKENTATVLTTGQQWEELRASYWGQHNRIELAVECSHRAKEYENALNHFLKRTEKR